MTVGGDKVSELLSKHFAESFKREVDADEAIWRSLPFFAALLGLAIAVLPAIYRQAIGLPLGWWSVPSLLLLFAALISFVVAAYWFGRVITLRRYRLPPTDAKLLSYAEDLDRYYTAFGSTPDDRDEAVAKDLRASILDEFASASTTNRAHNIARSTARSQALIFVMAGFLLAFLSEGIILMRAAVIAATENPSRRMYGRSEAGVGKGRTERQAAQAQSAQAPVGKERRKPDPVAR